MTIAASTLVFVIAKERDGKTEIGDRISSELYRKVGFSHFGMVGMFELVADDSASETAPSAPPPPIPPPDRA